MSKNEAQSTDERPLESNYPHTLLVNLSKSQQSNKLYLEPARNRQGMNDVAIRVEHLSKQYTIGGAERATNMRELLTRAVTPWKWIGGERRQPEETFWALKDVSFEVKRGEVVGVIGRNGAGKSTLLKVLSRITEPTGGMVKLKGQIGSLLEVGTGFHPELTGRENIYLNGAVLGMSHQEVQKQFDEIVAFAEVDKFLDTPVKWYSSGMYLRLAFSVAAHLNPEILIVDEVLAVGDAAFQKKCLGKMNDVSQSGRTVLFVSHNMTAIEMLCTRGILLAEGRLSAFDKVSDVIQKYLATGAGAGPTWSSPCAIDSRSSSARFMSVTVCNSEYAINQVYGSSERLNIIMSLYIPQLYSDLTIGFDLNLACGTIVLRSSQSDLSEEEWPTLVSGINTLECTLPAGLLNEGSYTITPWISHHCKEWICKLDDICGFDIRLNHGISPLWAHLDKGARPGIISPILQWKSNPQ